MDSSCAMHCWRCLEDYSQTILAHTQSQIAMLVGLDGSQGVRNDIDDNTGSDMLEFQEPSLHKLERRNCS
ncbi:unnamed protein product, partial [Penicillium salamii]